MKQILVLVKRHENSTLYVRMIPISLCSLTVNCFQCLPQINAFLHSGLYMSVFN